MTTKLQQRVRLRPEVRKARIREAAREVFAARGYAPSGLAEIAERSGVSKALLYHYFRGGRPQLMAEVMDELLDELTGALRLSRLVPGGTEERIESAVTAFLSFFALRPDAFRLLFREPWGPRESLVVDRALHTMDVLSHEFAVSCLPPGGSGLAEPADVASRSGALGMIVAVTEALLDGQVAFGVAAATASAFIAGGLARVAA